MGEGKTTGARILRQRLSLGLTRGQLAQQVGVSASYIRLLETGECRLNEDLIRKFAKALGVRLAAPEDDCEGKRAAMKAEADLRLARMERDTAVRNEQKLRAERREADDLQPERYTREEVEERLLARDPVEAVAQRATRRWEDIPEADRVKRRGWACGDLEAALSAAFPDQQPVEDERVKGESLVEAAHKALHDFDEMGDYEAPVQALRDLLEQQPEQRGGIGAGAPSTGGVSASDADAGVSTASADPASLLGQQGEAEDWPEVWVTKDREGNIVRALVDPASPAAFERMGYTTRHYLPAPAQHPMGLSEEERERLERIANFCSEHWDPLAKEDAAALRDIASRKPDQQQHPTGLSDANAARVHELLRAIDAHRDTLDRAAAGGPQPKHRDDVDNALYNVASMIAREIPRQQHSTEEGR